ncbi:Ff.00g086680.m01.CDS01 [Fusarium sp. VM40]|nr:Ff.00g086680.m01.CDS01 [Fusarium sp. VM40]
MPAPKPVANVAEIHHRSYIYIATKSVPDHTVLATTVACRNAMIQDLVATARNLLRFSVRTRVAPTIAASNASHASSVTCSDKKAIQIDCLGLRPYSEINLDENPIVVVGCGHFFAGQTLDGLVGLDEVYSQDQDGQFVGLKDISGSLSVNLPFCPECKCPLRQFAVRRYNRLVNRAVMDDICRKFLIQTRDAIQQLEKDLRSAEKELKITRATVSSIAERHSKLEELRKSAALIKRETLSVAKQIVKNSLGNNWLYEFIFLPPKSMK